MKRKSYFFRSHAKACLTAWCLMLSLAMNAQNQTVRGTVTDQNGEPVVGATVRVKGDKTGTITDLNGQYTLTVPAGTSLEISYVGYKPQEVRVRAGNAPLNIMLQDTPTALSEVVVTALGLKRESKALGYAMTELNADDLDANLINPVQALQGKVAGVEVSSSDGGMFGASKILIRGASTLNKNNQPIYVVDGVILDNDKPIDLQTGEIDAMLATDNVRLSGSTDDKLEKVYLQLLIHFSEQCDDQYITARRSGYPKTGSELLPFVQFQGVALSAIPRRFVISEPQNTDLMFDIKMAAYKAQGFNTLGTNSQGNQYNSGNAPLNTERVWQDKNAPQWGTPK